MQKISFGFFTSAIIKELGQKGSAMTNGGPNATSSNMSAASPKQMGFQRRPEALQKLNGSNWASKARLPLCVIVRKGQIYNFST